MSLLHDLCELFVRGHDVHYDITLLVFLEKGIPLPLLLDFDKIDVLVCNTLLVLEYLLLRSGLKQSWIRRNIIDEL